MGIARSTVCEYLRRAAAAGLSWPLPESMTEAEVDRLLFPPTVSIDSALRPEPDWATVHQELRRKGVTLVLLWQEYKAAHPEGYGANYQRLAGLKKKYDPENFFRVNQNIRAP